MNRDFKAPMASIVTHPSISGWVTMGGRETRRRQQPPLYTLDLSSSYRVLL